MIVYIIYLGRRKLPFDIVRGFFIYVKTNKKLYMKYIALLNSSIQKTANRLLTNFNILKQILTLCWYRKTNRHSLYFHILLSIIIMAKRSAKVLKQYVLMRMLKFSWLLSVNCSCSSTIKNNPILLSPVDICYLCYLHEGDRRRSGANEE